MLTDTQAETKNGSAAQKPSNGHTLPGVPDVQNRSTRLIRRAVPLTFLILGVGLVGAVLVASFVKIDVTIDARGRLEPVTRWPVRSMAPGIITEIFVAPGDTVQEGQVLVHLDSLRLKSERVQLQSQLRALQVQHRKTRSSEAIERRRQEHARLQARAELLRAKAALREKLAAFGYGTNVDSVMNTYSPGTHVAIDQALADVLSARADLRAAETQKQALELNALVLQKQQAEMERLKAQIGALRKRLGRLKITAPAAGVVLADRLRQRVGSHVQEGELLFKIAALEEWQVSLYVSEQEVDDVHVGDAVKVKIQALQESGKDLIRGHVTSIAPVPISSEGQARATRGLYRVTVALNDRKVEQIGRGQLRQGYSVQAGIITTSGRIIELLWRYLRRQTG